MGFWLLVGFCFAFPGLSCYGAGPSKSGKLIPCCRQAVRDRRPERERRQASCQIVTTAIALSPSTHLLLSEHVIHCVRTRRHTPTPRGPRGRVRRGVRTARIVGVACTRSSRCCVRICWTRATSASSRKCDELGQRSNVEIECSVGSSLELWRGWSLDQSGSLPARCLTLTADMCVKPRLTASIQSMTALSSFAWMRNCSPSALTLTTWRLFR